METRIGLALAVALSGLVACGDDGNGNGTEPGCTTHDECPAREYCAEDGTCVAFGDPDECRKAADCAEDETCVANECQGLVIEECDKAPNVARAEALVAAQPALAVAASSGKAVKTFPVTFASLADDPQVRCEVALQFRDLNGDGALQPYEDWTRPVAERVTDLLGRMSAAEKLALMAHGVAADTPTVSTPQPTAATLAMIGAGLRFASTAANNAQLVPRATWANHLQAACEASPLGIPFVVSTEPVHSSGNGRVKARGFSQWPNELAFGATGDLALVETFGGVVAQEYRAIGIRMALSVPANLATEPRLFGSQFTFGEDPDAVAAMVRAYVRGLQGTAAGTLGVAAVVGHFPGAGPAKDGWDARLAKGRFLTYPGDAFDAHVGAFAGALEEGVAAVMTGYGVPEAGDWTGLGGLVTGATIEQVGASFHEALVTGVLREHYGHGGLVVAPPGVTEDAGLAPFGAPWGLETETPGERVAKAVAAGVDQFLGLNDPGALTAANLAAPAVDAAAGRALALIFRLGLFENPYVDAERAPAYCNTGIARPGGLDAMNRGLVLLVNVDKPDGWLDGDGDGTQTGDKGNAGNGSGKVLPAPPGQPYVAAGCDYFVAGDFDLDYVKSVSTGYGNLTNDSPIVKGVAVDTDAERMALSDYVFVRIAAPATHDPDSGELDLPLPSLTYAGNDPAVLAPVAAARAAIDGWSGTPASRAQIVVAVDGGRPSVASELVSGTYGISGLYLAWMGTFPANGDADKVLLDVAFGIVDGRGKLPVGLPASDEAAANQHEDVAGDGGDPVFVRGFGLQTNGF